MALATPDDTAPGAPAKFDADSLASVLGFLQSSADAEAADARAACLALQRLYETRPAGFVEREEDALLARDVLPRCVARFMEDDDILAAVLPYYQALSSRWPTGNAPFEAARPCISLLHRLDGKMTSPQVLALALRVVFAPTYVLIQLNEQDRAFLAETRLLPLLQSLVTKHAPIAASAGIPTLSLLTYAHEPEPRASIALEVFNVILDVALSHPSDLAMQAYCWAHMSYGIPKDISLPRVHQIIDACTALFAALDATEARDGADLDIDLRYAAIVGLLALLNSGTTGAVSTTTAPVTNTPLSIATSTGAASPGTESGVLNADVLTYARDQPALTSLLLERLYVEGMRERTFRKVIELMFDGKPAPR